VVTGLQTRFNLAIESGLLLHQRLLPPASRLWSRVCCAHLVLGVKTQVAFAQDVALESAVLGHACVVEFLGVFCFIAFVVDADALSNSLAML